MNRLYKQVSFLVITFITIGFFKMAYAENDTNQSPFYALSFTSIDGEHMPLSRYEGKLVLVTNTASLCGFTKQYGDLQALYDDYKNKGLVVIGTPSNNFGNQEPGSEEDIKKFCETNFNISFPMTEKLSVKGDDIHPFYAWIRQENQPLPKWNFYKYLIDHNGKLVETYSSMTNPNGKKVRNKIDQLLNEKSKTKDG